MNAFAEYAASRAHTPRQRPAGAAKGKPHAGGVLKASALEEKMQEKQRLSRAFRAWRRAETKETLASEPRLGGFLRYLRTVTAETGGELIEAIEACDWLQQAPQGVRIFALRMINARCDKINQALGNDILDDPIPPEASVYFRARDFLHAGGRA